VAVVDYERAWHALLAKIAERDGWGSAKLTLEAARIAGQHQVSEGFIERALRMYGGEVTFTTSTPGGSSSAPGSKLTDARDVPPATADHQGDHDGPEHPRR
jgi:hypothetical protein